MKIIERNLQEIGKSLFVSLPKEWVNAYHLKKGSRIKMMSSNQGLLTIAPEFTVIEKIKETSLEYDDLFKRKFFREYFNGHEKLIIKINKKIPKQERKEINEFLKRFITIQVIDESQTEIVLKSFKIEELSIEECMKRLYFLSLGIFEEIEESSDKDLIQEIRNNITKFYYLLVMQIRRFLDEGKFTKENQISLIRAMDFRMAAEKIQRTSELLQDYKIDKSNEKIFSEVHHFYSQTVLSFLNNNYSNASHLWNESKKLKSRMNKLNENHTLQRILRYTDEISGLIR